MGRFSIFAKKNKARIDAAHSAGWQQGFDVGRKRAVNETRKVFIKLLTKELELGILEYEQGISRAIEIIRKGKQ